MASHACLPPVRSPCAPAPPTRWTRAITYCCRLWFRESARSTGAPASALRGRPRYRATITPWALATGNRALVHGAGYALRAAGRVACVKGLCLGEHPATGRTRGNGLSMLAWRLKPTLRSGERSVGDYGGPIAAEGLRSVSSQFQHLVRSRYRRYRYGHHQIASSMATQVSLQRTLRFRNPGVRLRQLEPQHLGALPGTGSPGRARGTLDASSSGTNARCPTMPRCYSGRPTTHQTARCDSSSSTSSNPVSFSGTSAA